MVGRCVDARHDAVVGRAVCIGDKPDGRGAVSQQAARRRAEESPLATVRSLGDSQNRVVASTQNFTDDFDGCLAPQHFRLHVDALSPNGSCEGIELPSHFSPHHLAKIGVFPDHQASVPRKLRHDITKLQRRLVGLRNASGFLDDWMGFQSCADGGNDAVERCQC